MSVAIVIPLKAKSVAKNWQIVEDCLRNTISSIEKQSNKNFIAVVVGHDKPLFMEDNKLPSNIKFLQYTEKEPPVIVDDEVENQKNFEIDRVGKIFYGFKYSLNFSPSYLFPLDADDLISKKLVEITLNNKMKNNILIKNGVFFYKDTKTFNKSKNFDKYCGSSMIANIEIMQTYLSIDKIEDFLFKKVGHVYMEDFLIKQNLPFSVPDTNLVMYVRDNGENISRSKKSNIILRIRRKIKIKLSSFFFKKKILEDFLK